MHNEIIVALAKNYVKNWIQSSNMVKDAKLARTKAKFYTATGILGIKGAVDGSLIPILNLFLIN